MKRILCLIMSVLMATSAFSVGAFSASAEDTTAEIVLDSVTATVTENTLSVDPEVTLEQTKINYLDQTITVENADALIEQGVTSFTATAQMVYDGNVTQEASETYTLESGVTQYSLTYPTYGKFTTTLEFSSEESVVCTTSNSLGIIAEEYNLAPLNASFPVIYFTLDIQDKCVNENGDPVPSFVFLQRTEAYDWDNLTENLYALPYATTEQINDSSNASFFEKRNIMVDFVKDLYEVSPQSQFNLYTVDNYCENMLILLTANGIPEDQYYVYLLSDGSGSYSIFNDTFNSEDSYAIYDEMAEEWARLKQETAENGAFDEESLQVQIGSCGHICQILERYPYVMAKEDDNIEWWLARVNDTLTCPDADFLTEVKAESTSDNGCIKVKSISTMLTALQEKGDDAVNAFKTMYKFNDDMFSEAYSQGKKVMMILGTRVDLETNFEDYAEYVMNYYGDEYVYYYKGHPATPTGLHPDKQTQLDSLGITDVESSIAAELIIFYNPDIYLCGYSSSTFISVSDDEKACVLFNSTKENAYDSYSYASMMDSFVSQIDVTDDYYSAYASYCTDSAKSYYLIEYNNDENYTASIYNATDKTFINFTDAGDKALYNYSIVNNGEVIESGYSYYVTLPTLASTSTATFSGWTDGTVTYPGGISVLISGDITFTAVWTAVESTATTVPAIDTVKLSKTTYVYNGKKKKPTVTVTDVNGNVISSDNYTVTYESGRKKVGKYKVTVTFTGNYSGTETLYFTIKPKKTAVKKITANSKSFTVKWKKRTTQVTGYQVQYATNKKFTKNKKTVTVKSKKTTSKTVKNLKSNKTYYVRVRTYKTVDGKKIYSKWSTVKKVTVK